MAHALMAYERWKRKIHALIKAKLKLKHEVSKIKRGNV
jgi:hypothetical protein